MKKLAYWFITLSRQSKASILIAVDVFFAVFSLWIAFSLRLGVWYIPEGNIWILFCISPVLAVPIFIKFGLYRAIIRYIGGRVLWVIFQSVTLYALAFTVVIFQTGIGLVPRTVTPLNWLLMLFFVGGSRFIARWWLTDIYVYLSGNTIQNSSAKSVIIYGAGSAGVQLASALAYGQEFNPVAFLDDDKQLHRQKVNGLRIYSLPSLSYLIERHKVTEVLLALPSATRSRRNEIIRLLEPYPVHVRSVPGMADIAQGKVKLDEIQEVDIADLLGRDSVAPDPELFKINIIGKVVMVTGAGGSIGSELCRQIIQLRPAKLILFELNEYALYSINKELNHVISLVQESFGFEIVPVIGSIADSARIKKVYNVFQVQTVYHAAAYKHVPLVEQNPCEAIKNNIFGTLIVAQAAISEKVETFVLISTDKAVRPTNMMGATKRFAELVLQGLSLNEGQSTRFTMVRFGNVLGSSGSVIPLFREQIARGGPVTVTDTRVIRYFMTIPEAAQLVIQAGAMGLGGDVFVLDMGESIRIDDLAKRMINLSGLEVRDENHPNGDIEISYTGLRPGEKLYEELLIGNNVSDTVHPRILRAEEEVIPWGELSGRLKKLKKALEKDDLKAMRVLLKESVSGFSPQCGVGDVLWVAKESKDIEKLAESQGKRSSRNVVNF